MTEKKPKMSGLPILNMMSSKKLSVTESQHKTGRMKSPKQEKDGNEAEELKKLDAKYRELAGQIQILFLEVNNRYYDINDIREKFQRKQNEFSYQRSDPIKLLDMARQMIENYINGLIKTEQEVQSYKLLTDEETQDYIWLLQKSERDMRNLIRENQQLKLLVANQEIKLQNVEKQIELLTEQTQKAMEEMKKEFSFAIDLLADRESKLNTLRDDLKHKLETIRSLEEQLISVLILEHKIGHLGQKQAKEATKLKQEFNETIKQKEVDLKSTFQLDAKQKDQRITQLEAALKQMQIEKHGMEKDLRGKIDILNKQIHQQGVQIAQKIEKIQQLQSQLIDNQHLDYLRLKASHISTK